MITEYSTQKVLELACCAQRTNGSYLKEAEYRHDINGKFLFVKHTNKDLIRHSLGQLKYDHTEQEFRPVDLFLNTEDTEEAYRVRKYFRKLIFSAVAGTNEFETEVNALLESETVPGNKIGYIACLPSIYQRERAKTALKQSLAECINDKIADPGTVLFDKDCEVIQVTRSKNFDAWNVLAIIENKIVGWMSNQKITTGPAVVIKAKVKDIGRNYQTDKIQTRLHYVKVAQ